MLSEVGARRWIARILLTSGVISGATAFVTGTWSFLGIRFLLGLELPFLHGYDTR